MAKLLNEDASKAVVPNLVAAKHKVDVSWAQSYETFMHLYKRLPLSDYINGVRHLNKRRQVL